MCEDGSNSQSASRVTDRDFDTYKLLLDLWKSENPIKTNKLQVLLAVNAILVSALSISGGFTSDKWFLYLAAIVFNLIWTFSIGRTSLYQDVWKRKINEISERHPEDPRFQIFDTDAEKRQSRRMLRLFGSISSKWYLLFAPVFISVAWFLVLLITLLTV